MKKILYLYSLLPDAWTALQEKAGNSWEIDEQTAGYILSCMDEVRQGVTPNIVTGKC